MELGVVQCCLVCTRPWVQFTEQEKNKKKYVSHERYYESFKTETFKISLKKYFIASDALFQRDFLL